MTGRLVVALASLVAGYLIIWLVVYSVFMGFDYRFVGEYFSFGWLGGGEIPTAIQLVSLLVTAVGATFGFVFYSRVKRRSKR